MQYIPGLIKILAVDLLITIVYKTHIFNSLIVVMLCQEIRLHMNCSINLIFINFINRFDGTSAVVWNLVSTYANKHLYATVMRQPNYLCTSEPQLVSIIFG